MNSEQYCVGGKKRSLFITKKTPNYLRVDTRRRKSATAVLLEDNTRRLSSRPICDLGVMDVTMTTEINLFTINCSVKQNNVYERNTRDGRNVLA